MTRFYFDTETYPIRPGLMVPKLVCVQSAYDDAEPVVALDTDAVEIAIHERSALIEAHNEAYDLAVLANHNERFVQPIFRMLADGRGRDTQIRETLFCIREGTLDINRKRKGYFSLGNLAQKYANMTLDKGEESWRTRYALLAGRPVYAWPEEALRYALDDVRALRAVSEAQRALYEPPDEWLQVAAAFSLHLAAAWGVVIDQPKLDWVEVALLTRKEECERILTDAGFFRDGSVNKKKVQEAVEDACGRLSIPVPKTGPTKMFPQGQTKTDGETIEAVASEHPELRAMVELGAAVKNHSTYIKPMREAGAGAMNSRPNVLVASGRTSWGGSKLRPANPWWPEGIKVPEVVIGTNLQNFPKEEGVRDCIMARPGCWFSSTDYSALELRTFAQCCLWIVGYSTFADGFNKDPDWDPHCYFAGHLTQRTYAEAVGLHKAKDKAFKKVRDIAKSINFSLIGGVGARKFQIMARLAGIELTLEECYFYKDEWLKVFPETQGFFQYISWLTNAGKPFRQFVSGRIRGDVGYTDGANTGFQGLGGDISKYAMFLVSMACYAEPKSVLYGSRPVALVHDEILAEHPIPVAPEANMEVKRLMELAEAKFLPDIPARAEPTLMSHWTKGAKLVTDSRGLPALDKQVWDL